MHVAQLVNGARAHIYRRLAQLVDWRVTTRPQRGSRQKGGRVVGGRDLKNLNFSVRNLVRMAPAVLAMCSDRSGDAASGRAILLKWDQTKQLCL